MKLKINFPADKEVRSLPSRECGLKLFGSLLRTDSITVTPFAGVWIEMWQLKMESGVDIVTPFAGVWIEIQLCCIARAIHPVTPFAGVWIEIILIALHR